MEETSLGALFDDYSFLMEKFTGLSIYRRFPGSLSRELVFCNDTYAELSGWPREELFKLADTRSLQKSHHSHETSFELQQSVENEVPYGGTFCWVGPDGRERCVEYLAIPVKRGNDYYVVGFDRPLGTPGRKVTFN